MNEISKMHANYAPLKYILSQQQERKYRMDNNKKKIKSTTDEVLKNLKKLFSNLDNILFYKDLEELYLGTNSKKIFEEDDMIPITWDSMFKVMIYNDNRIKYSKYFLSFFLPDEYKDFTLYKSETNKNTYEDKEMVLDFAAVKDDLCIDIEMNNSNSLERNAYYLSRFCSSKVKRGEDYVYMKGLQININGFKPPHDKTMDLYYTRDRIGDVYIPQIFVNIYLQNLEDLYYNEGIEGLDELERSILVVTCKSKKEAEKLAKGVKVMEEYIIDAKNAIEHDDDLRKAYKRKSENIRISYKHGRKEGLEEGREEGAENKSIEIATNLLKCGMTIEFVHKNTELPIDEVKKIKNSFSKEIME